MMPSVMDERHEEIRSESISGYHLSEKPDVTRPLAEGPISIGQFTQDCSMLLNLRALCGS